MQTSISGNALLNRCIGSIRWDMMDMHATTHISRRTLTRLSDPIDPYQCSFVTDNYIGSGLWTAWATEKRWHSD